MNPDDFEKRLQRQPLSPPPPVWRNDILAAAQAEIRTPDRVPQPNTPIGWRALLARLPLAWGAVAALWLLIIGVNSFMSGPAITTVASSAPPAPRDAMTVWNLRPTGISLLANRLTEGPDIAPLPDEPRPHSRPRSDRRRDDGFGGFRPDANRETIA